MTRGIARIWFLEKIVIVIGFSGGVLIDGVAWWLQGAQLWHVLPAGILAVSGMAVFSWLSHQGERQLTAALAAAEAREARLRQLNQAVEQSPATIVITDIHGTIEYVNRKFTEITGYTREEALGQNPRVLKSGEQGTDVYRELWATIMAGREWRGELHNRKKNGELYWESASISALRDASGQITHFLAVKEDINGRKAQQVELQVTNQALETAIARAQEMAVAAEMANIAKSDFLARMSHEIRTPMNGVIGMTDLLLDTELSEQQRRYAGIVRSSALALLDIINDILDFSKIEARKLQLETLEFDLPEALGNTIEIIAERAQAKGLELVCVVGADVPRTLRGDPGRLRQIWINLLGNAVKFTSQGEVVLRVSLDAEGTEWARVRFEVSDTGVGIPAEKTSELFTAFNQVDGSITRRYGGTGLGLAIAKQLAELMGGEVGLSSEPGRGSTFWFTARLEKQVGATGPVGAGSRDLRMARILVVDDNQTSCTLLLNWITSWGGDGLAVGNGPDGLEHMHAAAMQGRPFQLVIIDQIMPDMDGLALIRRIRSEPLVQATPLLLMTPIGGAGGALPLADLALAGTLAKPLRVGHVRSAVAQALGQESGQGGVAHRSPVAGSPPSAEMGQRFHLLVADDNRTNQAVALGLLKKLGYQADVVANGREALERLQSMTYDLVLMDCQMPEMDGFEATCRIRQTEATQRSRRLPVVAMTADAMEGARDACRLAGMDDFISKPVSLQAMAAVLNKWLARREDPVDASRTPPAEPADRADLPSLVVPAELGATRPWPWGTVLPRQPIRTFR